jgi:hypothetical protein
MFVVCVMKAPFWVVMVVGMASRAGVGVSWRLRHVADARKAPLQLLVVENADYDVSRGRSAI